MNKFPSISGKYLRYWSLLWEQNCEVLMHAWSAIETVNSPRGQKGYPKWSRGLHANLEKREWKLMLANSWKYNGSNSLSFEYHLEDHFIDIQVFSITWAALCLPGGESLPVTCNPSTSRSERMQPTSSPKKPLPKIMNARHLSGGKRSKDSIDTKTMREKKEIYRPPVGSKLELAVFWLLVCCS